MNVFILFPHQLHADVSALRVAQKVILVEEFLFFRQYKFHKQKLTFHRASMKFYAQYLQNQGFEVIYVDSSQPESDVRNLIATMSSSGVGNAHFRITNPKPYGSELETPTSIVSEHTWLPICKRLHYFDTTDNWLEKRINESCQKAGIASVRYESRLFLNATDELRDYFNRSKRYFQTDFYIQQRKKRNILVDQQQKPLGGLWSFDADNRLKYPKNTQPPKIAKVPQNQYYQEAVDYVNTHFSSNFGEINDAIVYPTTFTEAEAWLDDFLVNRFADFGIYEDAIVAREHFLHHSLLTPMLNVGLLTPQQILDKTLIFATQNDVPFNSVEGFVRQIIGWREFIRGIYEREGKRQRTTNYWKFTRKIPASFYDGTTGIAPIDQTIKKTLKTGYCHHIERLMVLGNFMLLCEFDPDEVYRWFMELFIDAYDWVMVPNIYGMSQFADGGLMCTKPYISGSNYIFKMSDYTKNNDWAATWDALFWRFMHVHRDFFLQNPRIGMLVKTFDNMPVEKRELLLKTADDYLTHGIFKVV